MAGEDTMPIATHVVKPPCHDNPLGPVKAPFLRSHGSGRGLDVGTPHRPRLRAADLEISAD